MLTNTKDSSFLCFIYRTWENISLKEKPQKPSYDYYRETLMTKRKYKNHKMFGSNIKERIKLPVRK